MSPFDVCRSQAPEPILWQFNGTILWMNFLSRIVRRVDCRGRKGNMMKWREMLNADCPKRDASQLHDRCDLICPDLPKVL
jgi:hypothetical protein